MASGDSSGNGASGNGKSELDQLIRSKEEELKRLHEARRRWEEGPLAKSLEKSGERREEFETLSGLPTDRIYTPEHVAGTRLPPRPRLPGRVPVHARHPADHVPRASTGRSASTPGFGTPEATNERFKFLLGQGQPGLSTAFDLPTQMGLDSDDERAAGEVGQVGVAIDSLADMETVFDGIPLDRVSTSMTINAPAPVLVAMYVAVADKQGVARDKISGTAQNDVLKEYVARGTYIYPPKPSLRLAADLIAWCAREAPRFNAISLSGYHMREAGSTAVQEIAFTFANAIAYIEAVRERGVEVDEFAPRLSWIFNTHINFFEEIAKYRALRRLWARIMKERFGAKDPRSMMLRTHTQTGGSTLTAQQPENNIVRAGIQALAAALGGVQSMALSLLRRGARDPDREGPEDRRAHAADHRRGDRRHRHDRPDGRLLLRRVAHGRARAPRRRGDGEDRADGRRRRRRSSPATTTRRSSTRPTSGSRRSTRVSASWSASTSTATTRSRQPEYFRVDQTMAERQREKLERLRDERDSAAAEQALGRLRTAAESEDNLMPAIIEAVHAYCTLGEICGTMREVFGEYKALATI